MPATVWKGFISFGLVSFPVRLYTAARAETVHFHMLHKTDLSRVKEVWYCAEENKPVDRSEIVKGFETHEGGYVVVSDQELKEVAPPTATTMEILQFVPGDAVDPIYLESSYYVAAEETNVKAYALFLAALTSTRQHAIAKVAMHGREDVVLIRPAEGALVLHTLYYSDELHAAHKVEAPKAKYTAQELDLAKKLIDSLKAPFRPNQFHDTYRKNLEELIEQKRKGHKITPVKQPRKAPVVNLMDALKKSLKAAPKPAAARKSAGRKRAA